MGYPEPVGFFLDRHHVMLSATVSKAGSVGSSAGARNKVICGDLCSISQNGEIVQLQLLNTFSSGFLDYL